MGGGRLRPDPVALDELLQLAQAKGAHYADIRLTNRRMEALALRNGDVENAGSTMEQGFGVRAMVDGAWGFAGTARMDPAAWRVAVGEAVAIARASARQPRPGGTALAPEPTHVGSYHTSVRRDPFAVSWEDRSELLRDACARMRQAPGVHLAQAMMSMWRENKHFVSTEGSRIEQEITEAGAGVTALARGYGDVQRRSFSDFGTAGYEFIEGLDLPGRAATLGRRPSNC